MFGSSPIPFYLLLVNSYLFLLMLFDQYQEKKKSWRIPEWQMLFLGVIGGGLGGLMGQAFLKHKEEKLRFRVIFQMGALLAVVLFLSTRDWK
ncbi:DUF1294 domain-containing protein [Vagococcus salmoninarum]|uniref:DUF1294 domain-containing protein n=1 Tax=Vagococcus salmoninarum TaxID=2739 RepID=A0A429ZU21_9ENTE|nr:DUF1294 domain-containing protein [Vagococcus salmoninarum]MBE9388868.1 DUF1294 domain-containing protein [Vagococcus salmoninarum]RST97189.1 hypothetical protein CBF35_02760 [Vagococcus salmoninarum]